jgi:hypothetical protein
MPVEETGMANDEKSSEDPVETGPLEVTPPEGEQEHSHESEETLSPDEKSG